MYTYMAPYSKGAGQINITPQLLKLYPDRVYTPIRASVTIALIGSTKSLSEPIYLSAYNWALSGDVIKRVGPVMVTTVPRTFHFRYPRQPPTQIGNAESASRKLLSIYDFGTASEAGMLVIVKVWVKSGQAISTQAVLDQLPEKTPMSVDSLSVDFELMGTSQNVASYTPSP